MHAGITTNRSERTLRAGAVRGARATRLGEAFHFHDLEVVRVDLEGLAVSVVSPSMLHRMKKDTVRPKDWGDAEAIKRRFNLEEG